MKGLLNRLAARATGTSATVRSDARLAGGALGPPPGVATAAAGPSFAVETRPAAPVIPSPAAAPADAPRDPLPSPIERPAPSDLHAPRVNPDRSSHPSSVGDAGEAVSEGAALKVPAAGPTRLVDDSVDESLVTAPRSDPAFLLAGVRSPSDVYVVRDPPLLIPLAIADRTSVAAPALGTGGRTTARPTQPVGRTAEPDVHIHIGCIEVTAVHEPAAPRRRPVSAPAPMSLDAYLAKRGRG